MIYSLTLNPAVDLYINTINKKHYCLAGGKGINVSKVLKTLGVSSICLGFVGGKTGNLIVDDLIKNKISFNFVKTASPTRTNMKIFCGKEIEINAKSNPISRKEYLLLKNKLLKLTSKDILIVSGSLPQDMNIKKALIVLKQLSNKKVKMIFDTSSRHLLDACKFKPILVKPNMDELSNLFKIRLSNNKQIVTYAKKLIKLGAQNVLVSLGKDGAILVNGITNIYAKAPKGKVVSTVGAGDSMVAGFVYSYLKNENNKQLLDYAIACGSATCFAKGLAKKSDIQKMINKK